MVGQVFLFVPPFYYLWIVQITFYPLALQEAKDSSEIENIVTTHDDLYKENIFVETKNPASKEVFHYAQSLKLGFEIVRCEEMLLNKHIIAIQQEMEGNRAGVRTQAGTKLINSSGEIVYTPPQDTEQVLRLMSNLEKFINDNDFADYDPLIKMAIIHYQFESIHPFYDGNGRTGRIINILYLVLQKLLDLPILYLSGYIIRNKAKYYQVLQNVRTTAQETITLIEEIKKLMQEYKHLLREKHPKIYSQDLLNNLFKNPYTKTEFIEQELQISRRTALNYLDTITQAGLLEKIKVGNYNYYINNQLIKVLRKEK